MALGGPPAHLLPRLLDEAAAGFGSLPDSEALTGVFFGFPTLAESIIEHIGAPMLSHGRDGTEHANPRVRAVGRRCAQRYELGVDELMPLLAGQDIADQQLAAECLTRLQAEDTAGVDATPGDAAAPGPTMGRAQCGC